MKTFRIAFSLIPFLLGSALPASAAPSNTPRAAAQKRPNIILFLVDDMGWQDTSVPFYYKLLRTGASSACSHWAPNLPAPPFSP